MPARSAIFVIITGMIILVWCTVASSRKALMDIGEILHQRIEKSETPLQVKCRQEFLCGSLLLPRFYKERGYIPAWVDETGLKQQAHSLIAAIRRAPEDGLVPDDYHLSAIESLIKRAQPTDNPLQNPEILADLDLLLTDAFLIYAAHLLAGRVNPETIHSKWVAYTRRADLVQVLQSALDSKTVEEALKNMLPPHSGYERLKESLRHYRIISLQGGWPLIPPGRTMRKGNSGKRITLLRHHLLMTGELAGAAGGDSDLFDDQLEKAVESYQVRHGLAVDGIVGTKTLAQLNVTVEQRIRIIELNLERWRWLPHDLGKSYLIINIADFRLELVSENNTELTMRVVVGTKYRRTPVFSGTMKYLVINPYWYIPASIAEADVLPAAKKSPGYLAEQKIRVLQDWKTSAPEIDPLSIDWNTIDISAFPYMLRQDPGAHNALGRVKFIFPNKFNVYLHDTPKRQLFKQGKRSFSSGCIRIEKPIDLAVYLLKENPLWTQDKIRTAIDSGNTYVVPLPVPHSVHLLYWTAWTDSKGVIHFRDDIYDRDRPLDLALQERPPAP